jgi:sugar lactone lactonase YvrE
MPQARYEAHSGIPRTGWLAQGLFLALSGYIASNNLFDNGELLDRKTHRTRLFPDHINSGLLHCCPEIFFKLLSLIRNCTMNFNFSRSIRYELLLSLAILLAACGGGNSGGGATAAGQFAFSVGGTVSGLSGAVVLQNNGNKGDPVTITSSDVTSSKDFTFSQLVTSGNAYSIAVTTQPIGQYCTVSTATATGTVTNNVVNNVVVTCTTNTYSIGGTVAGLAAGSSVVLQDNNNINGDSLTVANGAFTFAKQVAYNSAYGVSVLTPPTGGEACTVNNGSGTVLAGDVSVTVVCSLQSYNLNATVTGLTSGTVWLLASNGDNKIVGNGSFTFASKIAFGSLYGVSVFAQPTGDQGCSVVGGTGTMGNNDVNVSINCAPLSQMGGSMQGAALSLIPSVSTLVGAGTFANPSGVTNDGTNLYVSDMGNRLIRKIVIATGEVTTLAGTGAPVGGAADGIGTAASFDGIIGITTDGRSLYVADMGNNKIRKIAPSSGTLSSMTSANAVVSSFTAATFWSPNGITTDGINLYVADTGNNKICKIVIATGVVSTLAGTGASGALDGAGTAVATFNFPVGITTDGSNLYVVELFNNKIRKIAPSSGTLSSMTSANAVVSSFTGVADVGSASGAAEGTAATFNNPSSITTDGTNLYVTDTYNQKIRKIVIATGVVSSLTGDANTAAGIGATDGTGKAAMFSYPFGITNDGRSLYVTDRGNNKIRKIQ